MLAAIAAAGWDDDVDIIFTTDHGELRRRLRPAVQGSVPRRRADAAAARSGGPRRRAGAAPAVVTEPVGLVDLAPTFCAIAGLPAPEWMEGKPLPVDDGDADARGFERVLTEWDSELFGVGVHLRTITRDGWVCTTYQPGYVHDGTEGELYDLADDPLQQRQPVGRSRAGGDPQRSRRRPLGPPAADEVAAARRAGPGLTHPLHGPRRQYRRGE